MRRPGVLALLLAVLAASFALPDDGAAVRLIRIAGGYDNLTGVTAPRRGDPAGTLYVIEQEGEIWRRGDGPQTRFLDIRNEVGCCGEQGLLGLAFDPNYRTNDLVYVNYTNNSGDTRIVRYRANSSHTRVRERTRRVLLRLDQPAGNHNGGHLALGPNGRIYTGQGDGGGSCDPGGRAQNLRSRHGKLLSINPRNIGAGWRIDGYGLRNPWGFSFDRAIGRLYIGDVGQDDWEEVSTRPSGSLGGRRENYGWDVYEGRRLSGCPNAGLRGGGTLVRPIAVYGRSQGCSITGGNVYRGNSIPAQRGWYFFGDFCSGRIWRLRFRDGEVVRSRRLALDTPHNITSFGEGVSGELYLTHQGGTVYRLARS
ncbi:MAG: PQQ-dependent sugar dehydrogenase [Gaiellaceae bacterium]